MTLRRAFRLITRHDTFIKYSRDVTSRSVISLYGLKRKASDWESSPNTGGGGIWAGAVGGMFPILNSSRPVFGLSSV